MKVTQITYALHNGEPVKWDYFPYATDDELEAFSVDLLTQYTSVRGTRKWIQAHRSVLRWLKYFDRQEEEGPDTDWPDPVGTKKVETTPGTIAHVAGYEVQLLGPPVPKEKPSWWDKHPSDMDEDEFREWMVADVPSDPAERS
jgi:hypothetical protein